MISFVRGRVAAVSPEAVVVEVGGFGVQLLATPATIAKARVGEVVRLATSLVVREDSLTLYGFADDDERVVFELLQTASGVGPRLALAMLGVHSPEALRAAVAKEDVAALALVPGIGRKTAQKIILELKDRLTAPSAADGGGVGAGWREVVHAGLLNLGYTARQADEATSALAAEIAEAGAADTADLLRRALAFLRRP
ncbi:MAG: Holliday junction branch migration protein RuvA [Acidothermus sp.]|nr:Holliday junction branch migration protein RuvA [Acidothermus sp.]MCL6537098.1 Holliday junction branch migration protein RuvA [Acidothermus sp.]